MKCSITVALVLGESRVRISVHTTRSSEGVWKQGGGE